jgi:hypothetical protein
LQTNKTIAGITMALLLLLFGVGVAHLFILRFESGDVYPAYSSLRSDPLGTRALYASLENIDSISVRRNYHRLKSLAFEPQTTFFYLGATPGEFNWVPQETIEAFDRLTQTGGRLVITFLPVTQKHENKASQGSLKKKESADDKTDTATGSDSQDRPPAGSRSATAPSRSNPDSRKENAHPPAPEGGHARQASIKKRWGIEMAFKEILPLKDEKHLAVAASASRKDLPPTISWHTNLHFVLSDDAWQTLYSYEELPLIVERTYGQGSILLCADSYFISNEALWAERHPQLLMWLLGGHSNLIFNEAHLGIYKHPSVAQYIRRYRFHWFFAALAVLALLFVWKSAAHFVPPTADDALRGAEVVSEKDYTQGLIALLRRNIAGSQILRVCAQEWRQTFKKSKRIEGRIRVRINELATTGATELKTSKDPVRAYQEITREVSQMGMDALNTD